MSDAKTTTYLEDVEVSATVNAAEVPTTTAKPVVASTTAVKRQRNLLDMFVSQEKGPADKKQKLSASSSSAVVLPNKDIPQSSSDAQALNSIPFSMSSFIESLPEEHRKLLKLECDVMGKSWLKLLKDEIKKPYFISLKRFLWEEGVRGADDSPNTLKVYPSPRNIYAWSNTPLGRVKVVIIGQDPYHGAGQAHGLCFSVPFGIAVPPSLRNIYAEIKAEYPEFERPKHGNLSAWAEKGVLMLNTCLTVKASQAGSHSKKGWETFTDRVVDVVDKYGGANLSDANGGNKTGTGRGVVFLAWGAWAIKRVAKLNKTKHLILSSAHPSPLSANKGFLGNGHFKRANEWLEQKYGADGMVDWCDLGTGK